MKVVLLNSVCYGSTGRITLGIARTLTARGDEALLLFGRGEAPAGVRAERIESPLAVGVHALLSRVTDRQGFYSKAATKRMIARIRAFAPDVIHLHNIHGYWLDIETLFDFLASYGKPVIWTLHDCWAFTGHCAYFDMAGCERWQTGCGRCPQKRAYPQSLLFDASARNFSDKRRLFTCVPELTLVTPSQWLSSLVGRSFLSAVPTKVLANGVDLTVFCPTESDLAARYGLTDRRIVLGAANIWEPRKGLPAFFELRQRLDDSFAIVLIGLSDAQIRALPAGVLGLARTADAKELAAWYTAADVFVDCTREENFPTTHLEALACGAPVVTFAAGGSAEMLTPACGYGVPVGDVGALVAAVEQALLLDRADCVRQARAYDGNDRLAAYLPLYRLHLPSKEPTA